LLCGVDEVKDYELAIAIQIKNIILLICATVLTLGLFKMSGSWHSLWALGLLIFYSTVKVDNT
jgi:hypothetical protein